MTLTTATAPRTATAPTTATASTMEKTRQPLSLRKRARTEVDCLTQIKRLTESMDPGVVLGEKGLLPQCLGKTKEH